MKSGKANRQATAAVGAGPTQAKRAGLAQEIFGVLALAAAVIVLLGTRRARRLARIGVLALVGTAICMAAAWLG